MIKVFLCDAPIKIIKGGTPYGVELGQRHNIQPAHIFQAHPSFQGDKQLIYFCSDRKRIVRKYGISDFGKVERYK